MSEDVKEQENAVKAETAAENAAAEEKREEILLTEAIKDQAIEGERPQSANFTLRKILGGDFLTAETIRKQIWLILMVVVFTFIYVANRYNCQKDLLEINDLTEKLKDAKYKALASSSELTEMSRESNVLEMLKNNKDSVLHIANQPPYIITVPEK